MGESEQSIADLKWTVKDVLEEVGKEVQVLDLPYLEKPFGAGKPYQWPDDLAIITSLELARLSGRTSGWIQWTMNAVGKESATVMVIEAAFNILLGKKMQEIADSYLKNKPNKDELRALAISGDSRLTSIYRVLLSKQTLLVRLNAELGVYQEQARALSREQSRREAQDRGFGRGG